MEKVVIGVLYVAALAVAITACRGDDAADKTAAEGEERAPASTTEDEAASDVGGAEAPKPAADAKNDTDAVARFIDEFKTAYDDGDVAKVMTMVDDGFDFQGGGKRELRVMIEPHIDAKAGLDFTRAKIAVTGNEAVVFPVVVAPAGLELQFVLEKKEDAWMLMGAVPVGSDLPDVEDPDGAFRPVRDPQY